MQIADRHRARSTMAPNSENSRRKALRSEPKYTKTLPWVLPLTSSPFGAMKLIRWLVKQKHVVPERLKPLRVGRIRVD